MEIKLKIEQFDFLKNHLAIERPGLFQKIYRKTGLLFEVTEDIATEIRDWAGEKIQRQGFDESYNLNRNGLILEQLQDLFFS